MQQYTPIQRSEICQLYVENNFSRLNVRREKKVKSTLSKTIKRLHERFMSSGIVGKPRYPNKKLQRRADENIVAVRASSAHHKHNVNVVLLNWASLFLGRGL